MVGRVPAMARGMLWLTLLIGCAPGRSTQAGRAVDLGAPAPERPRLVTVTIRGMQFTPARLEVRRGDRVQFVNADIVPHTATARDHRFDSGLIAAPGVWEHVFTDAGEFPYNCSVHTTMTGVIAVP